MSKELVRVKIERPTKTNIHSVEIESRRHLSYRQFLRSAVERNVDPIQRKLTGQQTVIELVDLLRDIDGIEQEELGSPIKPRWGKDDFLEKPLNFEID